MVDRSQHKGRRRIINRQDSSENNKNNNKQKNNMYKVWSGLVQFALPQLQIFSGRIPLPQDQTQKEEDYVQSSNTLPNEIHYPVVIAVCGLL